MVVNFETTVQVGAKWDKCYRLDCNSGEGGGGVKSCDLDCNLGPIGVGAKVMFSLQFTKSVCPRGRGICQD